MGRKSTTACYRELGAEMRRLREAAGLTGRQIGKKTNWDPTKISRIESGQVHIDVSDLTWYLGILRVEGDVAEPLIELCRRARSGKGYWLSTHDDWVPDSLKSLIYHESRTEVSALYEPIVVPGLLQIEPYARAMIGREDWRSTEELEQAVSIRMERQQVLDRRRGVTRVVFIHEHALRTNVGGAEVMHEQMLALALACGAPDLSVRVVPASLGVKSVFGNSFYLFGFDEHAPLVYLDSFSSGIFLEDEKFVESYRKLVPRVGNVALTVDESRAFLIGLAEEYEKGQSSEDVEQVRYLSGRRTGSSAGAVSPAPSPR